MRKTIAVALFMSCSCVFAQAPVTDEMKIADKNSPGCEGRAEKSLKDLEKMHEFIIASSQKVADRDWEYGSRVDGNKIIIAGWFEHKHKIMDFLKNSGFDLCYIEFVGLREFGLWGQVPPYREKLPANLSPMPHPVFEKFPEPKDLLDNSW